MPNRLSNPSDRLQSRLWLQPTSKKKARPPQTLGIGPQTLKNFRLVLSRSEVREAGASFQRQAQAHGEVQVAATPRCRHLQWPRGRRLKWPHLASVVCVVDVA